MRVKKLCYIEKIKFELIVTFEIVDIELISFYLKLKIERN